MCDVYIFYIGVNAVSTVIQLLYDHLARGSMTVKITNYVRGQIIRDIILSTSVFLKGYWYWDSVEWCYWLLVKLSTWAVETC
jgi:hypothetical protein